MLLGREEEVTPIEVVRSRGSRLVDARGKTYIDMAMGWCVGNFGWANPDIERKLLRFHGPTYVSPSYLYKPWEELAHLLADIAPGKLRKSFRATGGTEAVEFALQAAMDVTGRKGFLSLEGAYHGDSIGAMSVGDGDIPSKLAHCKHVELGDMKRAEKILAKGDIAAFIMEPIPINLGVMVPSEDFVHRMRSLCRKHGTLFIADEVACGFGRTGKLFASEHFDLDPDIMCLGKAITGGYAAMGATMTTDRVAKAMQEKGTFYSTFGWHPLSVQAAIASVRFLVENQDELLDNANRIGTTMQTRLASMPFATRKAVRGKGLAIAVEMDEKEASRIRERCRKRGVILAEIGDDTIAFFPALTIDERTARRALDVVERSI